LKYSAAEKLHWRFRSFTWRCWVRWKRQITFWVHQIRRGRIGIWNSRAFNRQSVAAGGRMHRA